MTPRLIVMLKTPHPGRVKTRLGRDIGMTRAAWWYRHQVAGLLRGLRDPRWDLVLAVSPDREGLTSRVWPTDLPRLPQGRGDLGARMRRQLNAAPGPACLIGSDIDGLTRAHIADAFAALGRHDAVFGPAPDGGFWLIGKRAGCPLPALAPVRWSTEHALADTRACLRGWRIAQSAQLNDIDTAADLCHAIRR